MLATGCQDSKYPLVPVGGTVTFDGGKCPKSGSVTFQPLDIASGLPKRPATGKFETDGEYKVNAFADQEGVLPGRYRVEVTCFSGAPDLSKPNPWNDVSFIDASYRPAELVVEDTGDAITYDIDVPRNKSKPQQ
jgi:hypothetical protein